MFVVVLLACFALGQGNVIIQELHHPQPYKFGYTINDKASQQYREEAGNGAGAVAGSYGFTDARGIQRHVNYVADKAGFRAQLKTNEPGTANQNPAAVQVISSNGVLPYLDSPRAPARLIAVPMLGLGLNGGYNTGYGYNDNSGGMYGYNNGLQGGLGYSGLLGAGYGGGVVNFGADLVGGGIRGYDSRFLRL